ncbi:hypothetical protein J3E64_002589 [Sphingobium sp. OAS761]|nr:hypothetical protein [Sphingobium sp. OAS761]
MVRRVRFRFVSLGLMIGGASTGCSSTAISPAAGGVAPPTPPVAVAPVPPAHLDAPPGTGGPMPPPGNAEQAIRDQFAEAKRRDSIESYALFVARYPDHPLAEEAKRQIARLRRKSPAA